MNRIAFVRCHNEENTIIASLMSVENVFSNIVIIHSDITDSSLEKIEAYAKGRSGIIVEKYPHHVYPPHHEIYKTEAYKEENSIAAYTNFGIHLCKKIGGSISLVDADQVYIESTFIKQIITLEKAIKGNPENAYKSYLWGINSFVLNNKLLLSEKFPINGGNDHYILSHNTNIVFSQTPFYEQAIYENNIIELPNNRRPAWFHFMKRFVGVKNFNKKDGFTFSLEEYVKSHLNEIVLLSDELGELFEENIRHVLIASNSPYKTISLY